MAGYGGGREFVLCCLIAGVLVTPNWIQEIEHAWKRTWFGYVLLAISTAMCLWLHLHLPSSGWGATIMVVVAAIMALRTEMGGREKWLWFVLLLIYAVLEIRAINRDRSEQNSKFETIADGLKTTIRQGNTAISGLDATLQQIIGSDESPYFVPSFPAINSGGKLLFLVKEFYINSKSIPIVDVNVDVTIRPSKDEDTVHWSQRVGAFPGSPFHPWHYELGTVLPGGFESPIQLEAGNRYYFYITTRRGLFYEKINIDRNDQVPDHWSISVCLYRADTNTLIRGECKD